MTGNAAKTAPHEPAIVHAGRCELSTRPATWRYPVDHAGAIAAHWAGQTAANPRLFDGTVFVLMDGTLEGSDFRGMLEPTSFRNYLFWRSQGYPGTVPRGCFAGALLRSAEGFFIFGMQHAGYINAGSLSLVGGFIDPRDVQDGGRIGIEASIHREIREETGLDPSGLVRAGGYRLVFKEKSVGMVADLHSPLPAHVLRTEILAYIATAGDPELRDVAIVRSAGEAGPDLPLYIRRLIEHVSRDG